MRFKVAILYAGIAGAVAGCGVDVGQTDARRAALAFSKRRPVELFVDCLEGPGVKVKPSCDPDDLERDGDVDLHDWYLGAQ